jgi:hypothetical protein
MPDFTFYIDRTDRDYILNSLLDGTALGIIPNINYPTPFPETYRSLTPDLIRCLDVNPRCYISGAFSTRNIQTIKMENGAYAGTYVVTENKGGPVLALSLVTQRVKDDCEQIAPSHLTYSARFWDEQLMSLVPPSDALKAAFKQVRGLLMNACDKLKEPSPVWIGRSTRRRFASGDVCLLLNGVLVRATSASITSSSAPNRCQP